MKTFTFLISVLSVQKATFAVLLFVGLLCHDKAMSQRLPPADRQKQQLPSGTKNASPTVVNEFNSIIAKYNLSSKKERSTFSSKITEADRAKLEWLYSKMSRRQQSAQAIGFMPKMPPVAEAVPTNKQLEEWENAKVYGIWIDGKKAENNTLQDYSHTDFSHYNVSKLSKNAANYGKYFQQVDLMTKEYYQEYVTGSKANKGRNVMFVKEPE